MLLTDAPWALIKHRLLRERGYQGRPYAQSRRLTIEAILWIALQGRRLPAAGGQGLR